MNVNMLIFISAFILKQVCRCLFKCVCSDPCSVLHFSLFAFCKSLNVIGRAGSQNPSHNINTWKLCSLSSHAPTEPQPFSHWEKGFTHKMPFLRTPQLEQPNPRGAKEEIMQQMGWTYLKRLEFQLLAHFSSLSFVFPAWCPVLKQSLFPWKSLAALSPRWGAEQEG